MNVAQPNLHRKLYQLRLLICKHGMNINHDECADIFVTQTSISFKKKNPKGIVEYLMCLSILAAHNTCHNVKKTLKIFGQPQTTRSVSISSL